MTQSRLLAIRALSPMALLRENALGVSRSTPIAERWMTRLTPAFSQAAKSAAGPSVGGLCGIEGAVLKNADAINDGVDPVKIREPVVWT